VLLERLRRADIRLTEHDAAAEVTAEGVRTDSGRLLRAGLVVGVAGAQPHPWLARLGLAHENGFLTVDRELRSVSDPRIYAVGDCAHLGFAPRPKAGVYAVRAAPTLAHNLHADLAGRPRRGFRPQRDYLKLISLGMREAVADRSGFTLSGSGLWTWKDRIDHAFMRKLRTLPAMPAPRPPAERARGVAEAMGRQPPCAGCGAKLGPERLAAALARLPDPAREDVASRPGDDAAILRHGNGWQVMTTDHLRAFTEDPVTLARIAAIHALGDIWAMGAAPQAAMATVILPPMAPALAEATLAELMDAAAEVFRAEGAELAGGHSSVGAEMTLGFSVTGLARRAPLTLAGARPGDALILTKPIGSGTILAAEMQFKARGDDVAAALGHMARPQGDAARLLAPVARAMTDVTGFGLAGHLWSMCRASGCGARLDLAGIPLMDGAADLAARGFRSTLWPENRAALAGRIEGQDATGEDRPEAALLFDPQTGGGLLAAVPADAAAHLLDALTEAGHPAARVGEMTDAPPRLVLV
jgi:selenide,water dikinase